MLLLASTAAFDTWCVLPLSSIPNSETHFSTWFPRVGLLTLRRLALALQQPPPSSNRKRCCQLITHVKGRPSLRDRFGPAKSIDYRSTDNWSYSLTWLCCARIQADNHQAAVASVILLQDQPSPQVYYSFSFAERQNYLSHLHPPAGHIDITSHSTAQHGECPVKVTTGRRR